MARDDRRGCSGHRRGETGSVTAETAVLLPIVLLLLLAIAGVAVIGAAQVRVQQAAGAIAREHARGAGDGVEVGEVAGPGAQVSVNESGGWASVTVSRSVPLWQAVGPGVTVRATALARAEVVQQ